MIGQVVVLGVVAVVVFLGLCSIVRGTRGGCCNSSKQDSPPACQGCRRAKETKDVLT